MTHVERGWAMLAAAIIKSGEKTHDEAFLKSKWCSELRDFVSLCVEEQDKAFDRQQKYNKANIKVAE